jgi:hypothetical protein
MAVFWGVARVEEYYGETGVTTRTCAACDANYTCENSEVVAAGGPYFGDNYLAYTKLIEGTCTPSNFNLSVNYDSFVTYGNKFSIYANDNLQWTSGCVTGSGSATVLIPAGTHKVFIEVYGACNTPGNDEWSLSVAC